MRSVFPAGLLLISVFVPGWALWTLGGWKEDVQAGNFHRRQKEFVEAEKYYLAALQDLGSEPESDYGRVIVWNNLGFLRKLQNRLSEAEELFRKALALRSQQVQGKPDGLAGTIQNNLGSTYFSLRLFREAEAALGKALYSCEANPAHFTINCAGILTDLGTINLERGMARRAAEFYERAIFKLEATPEKDGWLLARALDGRAAALIRLGNLVEAERLLRTARPLLEGSSPHPTLAKVLGHLAVVHAKQGQLNTAEQFESRALSTAEAADDPGELAVLLYSFGWLRFDQHRISEADSFFRRALRVFSQTYDNTHPRYVSATREYSEYLVRTGRKRESKAVFRGGPTMCEKDPEPCHVVDVDALAATARSRR